MDREFLRKRNREEYNAFLLKINELYDPNEIGSIQNLARTKIMDFIAYCESKDVYYFSELPISKLVNELIFEIVKDSLIHELEEVTILTEAEKGNISPLKSLVNHIKLYRIRSRYFKLYSVLSEWTFESVYYQGYKMYYERLFNNDATKEEIESALYRDSELSIKLGMEEQFNSIKERIKKNKCKTNVQGKKSY